MTVQESIDLDFLPGYLPFKFERDNLNYFGLDKKGNRIWIGTTGNFDKRSIKLFARDVWTVCAMTNVVGAMKATDGQKIHVTFSPTIVNGRGTLAITRIERRLPPHMSKADERELEQQVKQRYGSAFRELPVIKPTEPTVQFDIDFSHGRTLLLTLPLKDVKTELLSQPGCSNRGHID